MYTVKQHAAILRVKQRELRDLNLKILTYTQQGYTKIIPILEEHKKQLEKDIANHKIAISMVPSFKSK